MPEKRRVDLLLFERGLAESRQRARAMVMGGSVFAGGQRVDKPGTMLPEGVSIEVRGQTNPYVSRGGLKLEKALECFELNIEGLTALDGGASTGGFTDCMLQHGAKKVYAVDVGYGQLAWKLRSDERVTCIERTNLRLLDPALIGEAVDFVTLDLSFISLRLVLPVVHSLLREGGRCMALVKPQFEAGRDKVGKKGVVRDRETHLEVLREVCRFARESGFGARGLSFSPILGPEGNVEFLLLLQKGQDALPELGELITQVVTQAHHQLKQTAPGDENDTGKPSVGGIL